MRLNGKPTTRLLFSTIDADEATRRHRPAVTRGGCMFMSCLLPPSVARILRWQHASLYGRSTSNRKPWRPRPLCTDCWMDRDFYHDSRATETWPNFQHLLSSQLLIQSDCPLNLHWVFLTSYIVYYSCHCRYGYWDVEDGNNTASMSSSMWTLRTEFNKQICSWKLNTELMSLKLMLK